MVHLVRFMFLREHIIEQIEIKSKTKKGEKYE